MCWPGSAVGYAQSLGSGGIPAPQSARGGGNARSHWWWSNTPDCRVRPPRPPHPSDLQPITNTACNYHHYTQTNTQIKKGWMDLLWAMSCCSSASGPCSCSGEVGAPVTWSRSSRRTTEGCLHSACSKISCSICLTVSALLPERKSQFLWWTHWTCSRWSVCLWRIRRPCSFLQSTTSTCASRCSRASPQRARDRVLLPLPFEEIETQCVTQNPTILLRIEIPFQKLCCEQYYYYYSYIRWYLGTSDEQSSSLETSPSDTKLPREGTTQKAVGDELKSSLTELIDPTGDRQRSENESEKRVLEEIPVSSTHKLTHYTSHYPRIDTEGSSGLSASSTEVTAGAATGSLSTWRWHRSSCGRFCFVCYKQKIKHFTWLPWCWWYLYVLLLDNSMCK